MASSSSILMNLPVLFSASEMTSDSGESIEGVEATVDATPMTIAIATIIPIIGALFTKIKSLYSDIKMPCRK